MRSWIFTVALAMLVVTCGQTAEAPPADWPMDKFAEALVVVHISEARIFDIPAQRADKAEISAMWYAAALNELGVEKQGFEAAFEWYSRRPERMKQVYDEVLLRLQTMEEESNHDKPHHE